MRINVELKDLRAGARLGKLARTMGWNERETLGALVQFWGATQDAEIVETTHDKLMTLIILDMDSDQQAETFIGALIVSQLVTKNGDALFIKGNDDHVARLKVYRDRATAGGIARSKKANDFVATKQPQSSQQRADNELQTSPPLLRSSVAMLLPPIDLRSPPPHTDADAPPPVEPDLEISDPERSEDVSAKQPRDASADAKASEPVAKAKKPKTPPHPNAKRMRELWCELFMATTKVKFSDYCAGFNVAIAELCRRCDDEPGSDERVVRAFFATQDRWVREEMRWGWRALGSKIDALRQEGIKRPSSRAEKLRAEIEKQDREMRAMMAMPSESGESSPGEAF